MVKRFLGQRMARKRFLLEGGKGDAAQKAFAKVPSVKNAKESGFLGKEVKIMPDTELEAMIRERNHTEEEKINLREVNKK